jgi:phosphomannomutase
MAEKYKDFQINIIDGVRIDFNNEWVHMRKSNTEPIIRIYSESETMKKADLLALKIMDEIKQFV